MFLKDHAICLEIEKLPASEQQTKVIIAVNEAFKRNEKQLSELKEFCQASGFVQAVGMIEQFEKENNSHE